MCALLLWFLLGPAAASDKGGSLTLRPYIEVPVSLQLVVGEDGVGLALRAEVNPGATLTSRQTEALWLGPFVEGALVSGRGGSVSVGGGLGGGSTPWRTAKSASFEFGHTWARGYHGRRVGVGLRSGLGRLGVSGTLSRDGSDPGDAGASVGLVAPLVGVVRDE